MEQNIKVLFPGGFKPITGAHMDLAERYAALPQVSVVVMMIGPNNRDGITRNDSMEIFKILNTNPKIIIYPTSIPSPMVASYEYLFSLPQDTVANIAFASSTKGDDYVRIKSYGPDIEKYKVIGDKKKRKIAPGINIEELSLDADPLLDKNGVPISATTVRDAVATKNFELFASAYPKTSAEKVKQIWKILTRVEESMFSTEWWKTELSEDLNTVIEAVMNQSERKRRRWQSNDPRDVIYTIESKNNSGKLLTEGGAAGHMAHPWDDHGLTFNDMREIVERALSGHLNREAAVTEKTDGQNIQVTWKNGQPGFARNKGTIINPMTPEQLIADFERKYHESVAKNGEAGAEGYKLVVEAYRACAEDLTEALNRIGADRLAQIFKDGRVFANMEIIYPSTKNVIAYDKAHLQFHNLVEYDEKGNTVETDLTGGALMQRVIEEANAHMQNTFSFIPPQQLKLGRVSDFEDQKKAFFNEIDQLEKRYNLKDTDVISDYHKAWWRDVIQTKANELGYQIPEQVLTALIYRWAFDDKSTNIAMLKKQIDNPQFSEWVTEFDKKDFKQYRKQNLEPFESIFLRLGVVVLQNASNFLAANPTEAVQDIRTDLAQLIKELQSGGNQDTINKLKHELRRIEKLGGFNSIVPSEGLVFVYGGNTYKMTGAFAPVNQILGVLKYTR
jgi:hypothetical protein